MRQLHLQLAESCCVAHQAPAGVLCHFSEVVCHPSRGGLRCSPPGWRYLILSYAKDIVGHYGVVGRVQSFHVEMQAGILQGTPGSPALSELRAFLAPSDNELTGQERCIVQ